MRVRCKAVEHVPIERKCCPWIVSQLALYAGKEYEVVPAKFHSGVTCFCGARYEGWLYPVVGTNGALFIDLIDIDEGG
jgi:hypothetical protein